MIIRNTTKIDWSAISGASVPDWQQRKSKGDVFFANAGASVVDLDDGVGLIEFHTKANALNDEVCEVIVHACERGSEAFRALVIGNSGKHFSVGANLAMILEVARDKNWDRMEKTIRNLQRATMTIKYSRLPVVAAPFSSALGGGCEICLHSALVVAAKKTHMGLVEAGVGLVPSGGGTKELGLRAIDKALVEQEGLLEPVARVMEYIFAAKVSADGEEARTLFLTPRDGVVEVDDSPIGVAKAAAVQLAILGYTPGAPRTDIPVIGGGGLRHLLDTVGGLLDKGTITPHDAVIAGHIATILCGGNGPAAISDEEHFLSLEREAFLSLLGTAGTQQRIEYLLTHNAPLHN